MNPEGVPSAAEAPDAGIPRVADEGDFERLVVLSALPVLLAFTASWCAPCVWIYPHLRRFAAQEAGRLRVLALDVDHLPEIAARYRIASVPIVLLLEGGVELARSVGLEPERLTSIVEEAVHRLAASEIGRDE